MSEQHNYRIRNSGGWAYYPTLEAFEGELKMLTIEPLAEFYQPGIGWVRYNPQPVDYAAIIRRLVEAGNKLNSELKFHATTRGFTESVYDELASWLEVRNSAEVKKVLGEA